MTVEDLTDALDSVTWYNGLAEEILKWKNMDNYDDKTPYNTKYPDNWLSPKIEFFYSWPAEAKEQLQVIWMICVMLFGEYGTSPRYGWIENKDEFFDFIDKITITYREDVFENE